MTTSELSVVGFRMGRMKAVEVRRRRLVSHRLTPSTHAEDPADVVRWMGAIQAQDYGQSLWAVGARLRHGTVSQVERAIADARILRTWPMRGTIHLVPAEDARWMLALGAPRTRTTMLRRQRELEITPADLEQSAAVLARDLAGRGPTTRADVMATLNSSGIATAGQRGPHILGQLAHDAQLCLGPRVGTRQTYVLLDEWVPLETSRTLSREEALAELAHRFARGRGPVTLHDLARWASITVRDAADALSSAPGLVSTSTDGVRYWMDEDSPDTAARPAPMVLLAGFDEFFIGYRGRDEIVRPEHQDMVVPGGNGIYRPIMVRDGHLVGTWQRSVTSKALTVMARPFDQAQDATELVRESAAEVTRYQSFLELPADIGVVTSVEV